MVEGVDIVCLNTYHGSMATSVREEIRQTRPFAGPEQEAHIGLGRTWAVLDHAVTEALREHGITSTQFNVLRILRGAGERGLCRGEVMERMITKVPDATRLLDRMEAAGLIGRRRDTADRRFVTATITPRGLELLRQLDEPVQELHRRHFAGLDRAELRVLIDLLDRVREAV
jgi:DNA-binding MarR family transcriptional regulator